MMGTCFSSWIGRPNPNPNLGLVGMSDIAAMVTEVEQKFGISISTLVTQPPQTMGALHTLVKKRLSTNAKADVWHVLAHIAADHTGMAADTITHDTQFFDRVYD